MPYMPGATISPDQTMITFAINVEVEQDEPGRASAHVTIGGTICWAGYVTWDESPMTFDNGVVIEGPAIAKQRAAREAVDRWLSKW
jgi:hypothetical protein